MNSSVVWPAAPPPPPKEKKNHSYHSYYSIVCNRYLFWFVIVCVIINSISAYLLSNMHIILLFQMFSPLHKRESRLKERHHLHGLWYDLATHIYTLDP